MTREYAIATRLRLFARVAVLDRLIDFLDDDQPERERLIRERYATYERLGQLADIALSTEARDGHCANS
jgi:hypothetical protein